MEAWTKSDEKRLKDQSGVIGTGCQTTSCKHTEKGTTTSSREEQRYMRDSSTSEMSESRPVFPSNYKSHDRALTVGTTLPAATIHG